MQSLFMFVLAVNSRSSRGFALCFAQVKRGSLLSQPRAVLQKLANISDGNPLAPRNSRGFLFQTLSPEKEPPTSANPKNQVNYDEAFDKRVWNRSINGVNGNDFVYRSVCAPLGGTRVFCSQLLQPECTNNWFYNRLHYLNMHALWHVY